MKRSVCKALAVSLALCLTVGCAKQDAGMASPETAETAAVTAAPVSQPLQTPNPAAVADGTVLPATEDAGRSYVEETLFIGDSNTARYMMYADETGTAFTSLKNSQKIEKVVKNSIRSHFPSLFRLRRPGKWCMMIHN